jgi:fatty-acyl-CoA synthase
VVPGDDAVVEADGSIHLLGRGSSCINTGGEKVWAEEVEEVLKEHPGVGDAVVVGVPDERLGEVVCAVVEPARADLDEGELLAHARARLAGYKTPRRLLFVHRVGRAPSGKVDHARLRHEAAVHSHPVRTPPTSS